jgi:hypothetical protein
MGRLSLSRFSFTIVSTVQKRRRELKVDILYHDDIDEAPVEAFFWDGRVHWTPEQRYCHTLLGSACSSTEKPFLVLIPPMV